MKKEDINYELISKIEIQVQDTQFYLPGETIKGNIILNPQYKIKEKLLHLTLKITQYEFWDYITEKPEELKNIYTTVIQEENIEYKLENEELPKKENVEGFENCSIIMKEDDKKMISIPFEIKLDDKKILPTFQFHNQEYFLGIRHLILAECKEYNSSNYTGLFIGKIKNNEFDGPKEITESYMVGLGSLEIKANFPTLSIRPGDEINVDISTNSNLHFKKISTITQSFYRNIKWVGYMKNTLLDKTFYSCQPHRAVEQSNAGPDEFSLVEKVTAPIRPIILSAKGFVFGGVYGFMAMTFGDPLLNLLSALAGEDDDNSPNFLAGIVGGILGAPIGMISGFIEGIIDQGKMVLNGLNYIVEKTKTEEGFKNKISEKEKVEIIENIKKFVYFKDNKVVGFIKFAEDITPNLNGYYFNCENNIKIEVEIAGIILNRNKYLKTPIDLYDSEEYIEQMKNLFKN